MNDNINKVAQEYLDSMMGHLAHEINLESTDEVEEEFDTIATCEFDYLIRFVGKLQFKGKKENLMDIEEAGNSFKGVIENVLEDCVSLSASNEVYVTFEHEEFDVKVEEVEGSKND